MKADNRGIIVGARGSLLSVAQTTQVIRLLKRRFPRHTFELKTITTLGDRVKEWGRDARGIFVREIEDALLDGSIDMAVHSLKDMPSTITPGLCLAAAALRRDPRDAIITRDGRELSALKPGALVGTTSLRRQAQILRLRPDLKVADLRGNLDTRIRKLADGLYDAIIVARAGLQRLKITGCRFKVIPAGILLPACGQGVLGVEIRANDTRMARICAAINNPRDLSRVEAERTFLRETGGGCRLPVAVHGVVRGTKLYLSALIIAKNGSQAVKVTGNIAVGKSQELARRLAFEALAAGGRRILAEIDNES